MQSIPISLASAGMILAREIRSSNEPNSRLLCGKGVSLTDSLIEPLACHHNVQKSIVQRAKTSVVHIADTLVKASAFGFSRDDIVPRIQPAAWSKLGLTESMLEGIIEQVEDKLVEAEQFSLEIQANSEANPQHGSAPPQNDPAPIR